MLKGRLKSISEQIVRTKYLVDIGTDHAYIPIQAAKEGLVEKAFAADIRVGPVKIAEKNINAKGLNDRVVAVLSDGFEEFLKDEYSYLMSDLQTVIAGMGGTLITDILSRGRKLAQKCKRLVLQPMNDIEFCREWLMKNGFQISGETLAKDMGKLYVIIVAEYTGEPIDFEWIDLLVGPQLKLGRETLYEEYLSKLIHRRLKIISGLEKSMGNKEQLEECRRELELLRGWETNNA